MPEQETSTNIAFGYLSVLLCYLSKSTKVRALIRSQLRGGTFRPLLAAVDEFSEFNEQIVAEQQMDEEGTGPRDGLVIRLQGLVSWLMEEESISC